MSSVIVLSKDAIMALINDAVVGGVVDGTGHLILSQLDGSTLDLGFVKDHGNQIGLADDDHTQYAKADGSRGAFATVAQGVLAEDARKNLGAVVDITDPTTEVVEVITITNDGSSTSGWENRRSIYYKDNAGADPRLVSFDNEYGERRGSPAKHNTVAERWFTEDDPTNVTGTRSTTVPIIELMDNRTDRNSLWGVLNDGTTVVNGDLRMAYVLVLDALDSIPSNTPAGTVIVRTP